MKIWMRASLWIFCRRIRIENRSALQTKGPLLIASNHPNSFLDAIILDVLMPRPVWSLARGDAFKTKTISKILKQFKMLPVYRVSEGVENLEENYKTFGDCKNIFRNNGAVLIFSEGKCINEWRFRPLKKGTARLAYSCWNDQIPLTVLPLAVNYHSFKSTGKNVYFHFGNPLASADFPAGLSDGQFNQQFNDQLRSELGPHIHEIPHADKAQRRQKLGWPVSLWVKMILLIPGLLGWLINAPFAVPVRKLIWKKTRGTDHYDSILLAVYTFFYPVYLGLITAAGLMLTHSYWCWLVWIVFPLLAKAWIEIKPQFERQWP